MDIIQETFNFAKKIQKTDQYLNLKKAKKNNDNDEQLQNLINEFNLLKLKFEHNSKKLNTNKKMISENKQQHYENEKTSEKLIKLYDKIMENKNMINFNKASDEMNSLMNKINKILVKAINGSDLQNFNSFSFENKTNCSGNCHNCSECF